ncbi:hypothetical protein [Vulcaniibacterium tengchongense]|uniref:Lipoprotein n=1 Tax=Vulcaniibacterium tengchongense TaxID=1273429 RepID=A0A3N4VI23_9GAMM|nr:hypothetical protein [Vulcaniibacterium tengchongense]RPE81333.1 hypothetical protein EDC50_0518 [Vulcaniibacterium tengchongense]
MKPVPKAAAMLLPLALAACAGLWPVADADHVAYPYPWCAEQEREAASLPRPEGAAARQLQRDAYVSKACQEATDRAHELRVRLEPQRRPEPAPPPGGR